MSKNSITFGALAACLILIGLALRGPGGGGGTDPEPAPEPEPVQVCATWQETVADRIPDRISRSDQLTLILLEMHEAGDLTQEEVQQVSDAIPDLTTRDRPLTADDAQKIRDLR